MRRKYTSYAIICMLVIAAVNVFSFAASAAESPVADAGEGYSGEECIGITFDATGSYDPDGDDLLFRWDFDSDGIWDTDWDATPLTEYIWRDDFNGIATLEVTDGMFISSDTAPVSISNTDPFIIHIIGPEEIGVGDEMELNVEFFDGDNRSRLYAMDWHTVTYIWLEGEMSENVLPPDLWIDTGYFVYNEPGEYLIEVIVTDDDGGQDNGFFTVVVLGQLVDAGPDAFINEGDMFTSAGLIYDGELGVLSATVDYGDGSGVQPLEVLADSSFLLSHLFEENGEYMVNVEVYSNSEYLGGDGVVVTVYNVAPLITEISGPIDPVQINTPVALSGSFIDPGVLDTHMVTIQWIENETDSFEIDLGTRSFEGAYLFGEPGVYPVLITVEDDDGGSDTVEFQYVVVYDPSEGFVTGGGWIISPPGAYPADPSLTGHANFGFVSKYKKGQSIPTGNTEFQFQVANLNFHSSSYDWLVVAGPKAKYKGTGTINGEGNYGFLISAIDGQINGGGGIDKFRMKIWDKDQGDLIIYDNNLGGDDLDDPSTALEGGQIVIHKK